MKLDWEKIYQRPAQRSVIAYVRRGTEVLLIEKKRGLGAGKIMGPGGKCEAGESDEEACRREVFEEVGLRLAKLEYAGEIDFYFQESQELLLMKIFLSDDFSGEIYETVEAKPFWQSRTQLDFSQMWEDDQYWLAAVLDGLCVQGRCVVDGNDRIIGRSLVIKGGFI